MPQREIFYVVRCPGEDARTAIITVAHEVPGGADELGSFDIPGAAIDHPQQEVRRLTSEGVAAEYVDPPDDLVGAG
jgi:hypothetical protein